MPALFLFLFKVNIALLLFCAGYYLVLRHLTFYTLNRVYLVSAIIFATIYPKIDLTGFAQKHEELARPVQNVAMVWQVPVQKLATHINYWQWAEYVFWAGAFLLAIRLAMQLTSLLRLYRSSDPAKIYNHKVRLMKSEAAPFSFWQSIYVNPANHTPADLKAILLHEQVHVNGWHTADILLAELSSICYWFNPGVWLMKKAVRENIEFITDRKILNKGFDTKAYQYSLVNVSFNNCTPGIVNHFNISTIKKRIIMMNAKRSSRVKLTRYVFMIPAVIALLLVFTFSKAGVTKPVKLTISNAVQPVTSAMKKAALTAIERTATVMSQTKAAALRLTKTDTVVKQTISLSARNMGRITGRDLITDSATVTLRSLKTDTGKKSTISIRTRDGVDSMNFVLNGKKISPAEFKDIDPNKISAINIMSKDAIDGLAGPDNDLDFDNNRQVLFITTSDSEAGKKLADKISKRGLRINLSNQSPARLSISQSASATSLAPLSGQRITAVRAVRGLKEKQNAMVIYDDLGPLTDIPARSNPAKLKLNEVTVKGYGNKIYTTDSAVTITGYGTGQLTTATGKRYKTEPVKTIILNGFKTDADVAKVYNYDVNNTLRYIDRTTGAVVTPVNMADKLYIIDGKEASEKAMKKLSAYDIDRINSSKDAGLIDKYGDKAKNGVVFIYTKKNKK